MLYIDFLGLFKPYENDTVTRDKDAPFDCLEVDPQRGGSVTIGTFSQWTQHFFLSASYLIATCDNLITRYAIFYLFSHEISISLMLSQLPFNFRAVHGYAFFSSFPF